MSDFDVDDLLERHGKAIQKALEPPALIHDPNCRNGKRQWSFNCYFPFIHTWVSTSICLCELNQIFRSRKIGPVQDGVQRTVITIDVGDKDPAEIAAGVYRWKRALRRNPWMLEEIVLR